MRYSFAALVGLLAVHQAAACDTCDWNSQPGLPSCQNSCNECTKDQQQGIDFSSLPTGNIGVVAGLQFSGCSIGAFAGASVNIKRDYSPRGMIKRWGSDSNCATGSLSQSSGPSFSCTGDTKAVSVNQVHLSVEHDTPVQLTYHYDTGANAGKTCTQTAQCSAGQVNQIQNTQCGGAQRVECALPPSAPKPSCSVGIHSIGFDCSKCSSTPAPPPPPPKTKTPPPPPPKSVAPPPPPSSPKPPPPPPSSSAPAPPPPSSSPAPPPPSSTPAPPPSSPPTPSTTPSVAPTSSPTPPSQANSSTPAPPVSSAAGSTVEVYTSEVVYTTITSCPVTHSNGVVHTEVSTVFVTSTKTICTKCVAPPHTKKPPPPPPTSTPSSTPAESPSSTPTSTPSSSPAESPSSTPTSTPSSTPAESPTSTPSSTSPAVLPTTTPPPQSTVSAVTTEVVYTTVTSCPVTHSNGQVTTILSTVQVTSTSTICTNCVAPPPPPPSAAPAPPPAPSGVAPPAPVQPSSAPQSPPPAPAPAPNVLPNCLQTWISLTKCKDNSDADCFCQNQSFTSNVQACISAWSQSPDEQQAALKFLAGICAPHVSANPQVIAPITPAPSAAAASSSGPLTTISISTTITVACPSDAAVKQISDGQVQAGTAAGTCTTTQVINKQVAVPQVAFSTSSSAVGLVAGTPAPAAAAATPAAPATSPSNIPAAAAPSSTSPVSPASTAQAASPADTGVASFKGAASKVGHSSLLFSVAAILVGLVAL